MNRITITLTDEAGREHLVVDCAECGGPYAITVDEARTCCYRCGATTVVTELGRIPDARPDRATRQSARLLCRAGSVIRSFAFSTQPSEDS